MIDQFSAKRLKETMTPGRQSTAMLSVDMGNGVRAESVGYRSQSGYDRAMARTAGCSQKSTSRIWYRAKIFRCWGWLVKYPSTSAVEGKTKHLIRKSGFLQAFQKVIPIGVAAISKFALEF